MRFRTFAPIAAALATLLVVSACADTDSITAPRSVGQQSALLGDLVDGTVSTVGNILMQPLHRNTPLAAPVTWSFVAGPGGATSSNSATGLTISIPSGALASSVTITVTAVEGTAVAYAFQPHGLQFAKNVRLTQSLRNTQVGLLNLLLLQGGHFDGDAPTFVGPLAFVNETSAAQLNLLGGSMSFPIRHFSGWIAGSGRSARDSESDSQ
jgi:hypothetical protein